MRSQKKHIISLSHTRPAVGYQHCTWLTQLGPQALGKSGKLWFTAGVSRADSISGALGLGKSPRAV